MFNSVIEIPVFLKHPMYSADRLGSEKCDFPIAAAFGDEDFFCSDDGAAEYIKMNKHFETGRS